MRNSEKYKEMAGKNVKYGDKIQLLHERTKQFVCVKDHKTLTISGNQIEESLKASSLILSPRAGEWTHFYIENCWEFQKSGIVVEGKNSVSTFLDPGSVKKKVSLAHSFTDSSKSECNMFCAHLYSINTNSSTRRNNI